MEISLLKQRIHHLIDSIEDEGRLTNLLQMLHQEPAKDIVDVLTQHQADRLSVSLQQAENRQGISHDAMKKRIESWFMK